VDLWEVLLKWIVLLLVADIGLRRIEIDRDEWGRWLSRLKRFGKGAEEESQAGASEESLRTLLGKRDAVRAAAPQAPATESSRVERPADIRPTVPAPPIPVTEPQPPQASAPASEPPGNAGGGMDRLLEAKRRARK
jgi:hypothetical protein